MFIVKIGKQELKFRDDTYVPEIANNLFDYATVALNAEELPVEMRYVDDSAVAYEE